MWILAGVLAPAAAMGQSTGPAMSSGPSATAIDVQNFWPSAGPQQAVVLSSSDVQPHLALGFTLWGNYMHRPLVLVTEASGQTHDVIGGAFTTDFVWGLGLFNRLQLGVAFPIVVAQWGEGIEPVTGGGAAAQLPGTATRDIRFDVGIALVQRARRANANGFGLRVDVGGTIPIGDRSAFAGASTFTFAPLLVADYRVWGFTFTANAGARVRGLSAIADIGWASQGVVGLGIAYRPLGFDRLSVGVDAMALPPLHGDLTYNTNGTSGAEVTVKPIVPIELFYGARIAVDRARDIEIGVAGGAPLTSDATVPEFRVIGSVGYSPHGYDTDGDGVPDAQDECPTQPEDRDGFNDGDGCPDADNDSDRIPDVNDQCPNAPEDYDNYRDDDGCPDVDNDDDGVNDPDDQCANEAAGDHPDPARRGCPLRDRDHDSVLDERDRCPDEAQGEHPDPARPGCPLPDRDHDAVADADDRCPADPAGEHPDRFRAGCPDPDRDHDGVPNEVDRCPEQPETINGVTDDDGCSDAGDEQVSWAGSVLIFQNAIHLGAHARAIPAAPSALLAQAAQRIRARGSDVVRVHVEVTPTAAGAAGTADAARLAGLVADALARNGVARGSIEAAAAPASAPGARRAPGGELRIRVETQSGPHRAPSANSGAAPSGASAPAANAPATGAPASSAPAPATTTAPSAGTAPATAPASSAPAHTTSAPAAHPTAPNAPASSPAAPTHAPR